jgi:enoyl-CoA hydratase
MDEAKYDTLSIGQRDGALTITLNRPDRLNAFDPTLHHEFARAIADAAKADDIRVIVLTGAGRAFSAGGDMSDLEPTPRSFVDDAIDARAIFFGLLECEKPVVCRLNGDAIGLGATVALLCDVVVAADTARIGDPHVKMGLVAGDGGAVVWPLLAGPLVAKYYLLTGDLMPASEAKSLGLVTKVVPAAELDAATEAIVQKLAKGAPLAIRLTKRSINASIQALGKLQFDLSLGYEGLTMLSADHAEARAAFLAKRKPTFAGR